MKFNLNQAMSAKVKPANYLRSLYENMKVTEDSDNPPLKLEHEESKLDKDKVVTIRLPISPDIPEANWNSAKNCYEDLPIVDNTGDS